LKTHVSFLWVIAFICVSSVCYCIDGNSEGFEYLPVQKIPQKALADCNGDIVDSVIWRDKNGTFIFIACEKHQGKLGEASWKSELTVKLFELFGVDSIRQCWKIYDFNDNALTTVGFLKGTRKIVDIDSNSVFETVFMYDKIPDGLEPIVVKLMLHNRYQKYAIRGQVPKDEEYLENYQKNFDPSFDSCDPRLRAFASKHWDEGIYMHWKNLLGDSVVEKMILTQKNAANKKNKKQEPPPKNEEKKNQNGQHILQQR